MTTQQPSFWCIGNIGDADPFNHGGGFVLIDRTGVYSPELLVLKAPDDEEAGKHELSTILLDRLTRIKHEDGRHGLSDNRFHSDHVAWFGLPRALQGLSEGCGRPYPSLLDSFLSGCPVERALAYMDAARYFGLSNFSGCPVTLEPKKAQRFCNTMLAQIEESKTWHDGYGVSYNG